MLKRINTARKKKRIAELHRAQVNKHGNSHNPYFSTNKKLSRDGKGSQMRKKCVFWIKKDGWAILGIFLLIAVTTWYFGLYTQTFRIQNINVAETQYINQDDVTSSIDQYTSSKFLGFIKRNTFWTLRAEALESAVIASFSDSFAIESVEVNKDFPNTISIAIQERIPSVIWITTGSDNDLYYSVDLDGFVTQVFANKDDFAESFPIIRDNNRGQLEIGWQIVSADYMNFLLQVHEMLPQKTKLKNESYVFPNVQCQERQYVAEKIFQQEILESASDEYREKKRNIQELFQQGLLTIDQSLDELEHIKNEELVQMGEIDAGDGYSTMQWESIFVPIDCDFVKVATELHVVINQDEKDYSVYLDSALNIDTQIQNLISVLQKIDLEDNNIQYIDLRFPDRVYYQ